MNRPPRTVLVVDRNPRNLQLLVKFLVDNGFQTRCAPDLAEVDALLGQGDAVALAVVDVDGFDAAIWERCRRLRERQVEVLVVGARQAISLVQRDGARCGVRAVLAKPLSTKLLAQMVRDAMEAPA